jgi:ubiquitin C-terminal hydrolase
MEGDNAYLCEELGKRVPAVKRTAIRTLPQMLCVHLKRFEFDYHNQTRHKLRDRWVADAAGALIATRADLNMSVGILVYWRRVYSARLVVSDWQF